MIFNHSKQISSLYVHFLNIIFKVLCDDCEGEILATEEDNASLKEVKVSLTLDQCQYCIQTIFLQYHHNFDYAGEPTDWLVEGGKLGFANSHSRLSNPSAPPPLPGHRHLPSANPNMECRFYCWSDQSGAGAAAGEVNADTSSCTGICSV